MSEETEAKKKKLERILNIPLKDWPDSKIEMVKFAFNIGWNDSKRYQESIKKN